MSKQVLVTLAQGIEEMEAITIIDVLRRAGAEVTAASVDKLDILAARGTRITADCLLADCMDKTFDLIALPGGIPGAENLKASKELGQLLKKQAGTDGYYGAICASPAVVLHHLGLVKPGAVICHPGFAHMIDNGNILNQDVVVEGNCITSRGAGTVLAFSLRLVEVLFSRAKVEEVRGGLAV